MLSLLESSGEPGEIAGALRRPALTPDGTRVDDVPVGAHDGSARNDEVGPALLEGAGLELWPLGSSTGRGCSARAFRRDGSAGDEVPAGPLARWCQHHIGGTHASSATVA